MEDEDRQPAKRARLELDEEGGESKDAKISRHPRIWFEDGNVILQAENKQFKVHRSILCDQSQIFKDMFSVPQPTPPSSSIRLDDCPIVVLPDSLVDIENVLSLLYDTMRIYNHREKMRLSVLGSMLRLGRKYRFKYLVTEALHYLNLEFPSELHLWDAQTTNGTTYIQEIPTFLFDVVYLAHEFAIKSILPAAYLSICSKFTFEHIRMGFNRPQSRHLLKTDEPISCLSGREKLYRAALQKTLAWLTKDTVPVQNCLQHRICAQWIASTRKVVLNKEINLTVCFSTEPWQKNVDKALCILCREKAKAIFESSRKQVWDDLMNYFEFSDKDFDAPWHTESFSDEA